MSPSSIDKGGHSEEQHVTTICSTSICSAPRLWQQLVSDEDSICPHATYNRCRQGNWMYNKDQHSAFVFSFPCVHGSGNTPKSFGSRKHLYSHPDAQSLSVVDFWPESFCSSREVGFRNLWCRLHFRIAKELRAQSDGLTPNLERCLHTLSLGPGTAEAVHWLVAAGLQFLKEENPKP